MGSGLRLWLGLDKRFIAFDHVRVRVRFGVRVRVRATVELRAMAKGGVLARDRGELCVLWL